MTEREGRDRGQIVILGTDTGERTTITNDRNDKTEVYAWRAPEYDGEATDIGAFVETLKPKLLSRSMRWSSRPANACGSAFLEMAPPSLAEIKGEQG